MPAKVFISCGQASPEERSVAQSLSAWFVSQGFLPYVAIETQSILDLNAGIVGELRTSDYYVFVNFRREKIRQGYRGSLFTNQELAMAYALGFEHMLLLNQKGVNREGVIQFMVSNTPEFVAHVDVLHFVQVAVAAARWRPDYTRHLDVAGHDFSSFGYTDHTGTRHVLALHVRIRNSRSDIGAVDAILRLSGLTDPDGHAVESPDKSRLKARGRPGYSQTIWPRSEGCYDLLAVDKSSQTKVYLHSELDVLPRNPIITRPGRWFLDYEVFSQGFPRLAFRVELELTGSCSTTRAAIGELRDC
jgi:hypothetical protein